MYHLADNTSKICKNDVYNLKHFKTSVIINSEQNDKCVDSNFDLRNFCKNLSFFQRSYKHLVKTFSMTLEFLLICIICYECRG